MKKRVYILFFHLVLCLPMLVYAQEPKSSLKDKIYIGGNFSLQFSTDYTLVNVSPLAGYKFTERFSSGLGATYIYYKYKNSYHNYTYSTNIYGGSVFSRYLILENLFAHAEFEMLSLETRDFFDPTLRRVWVPALFVGGGYQQSLGRSGFAQILVLYEVLRELNSPYQNPVIRIGFGVHL